MLYPRRYFLIHSFILWPQARAELCARLADMESQIAEQTATVTTTRESLAATHVEGARLTAAFDEATQKLMKQDMQLEADAALLAEAKLKLAEANDEVASHVVAAVHLKVRRASINKARVHILP